MKIAKSIFKSMVTATSANSTYTGRRGNFYPATDSDDRFHNPNRAVDLCQVTADCSSNSGYKLDYQKLAYPHYVGIMFSVFWISFYILYT